MKVYLLSLAMVLPCVQLAAQKLPECPPALGHIDVESGSYSMQPGVVFKLTHFSAELVPIGKTSPACYGKIITVAHGEIFAADESLTDVFSTKLKKDKSKIKNIKITNDHNLVTLKGTITKVVPVHFTIMGTISTDGSEIQLHAQKLIADGIPVNGLLELFGKDLSSVMKVKNMKGIKVDENTLSFNPEQLANLNGHIEAVNNIDGGLLIRYGADAHRPVRKKEEAQPPTDPPAPAR